MVSVCCWLGLLLVLRLVLLADFGWRGVPATLLGGGRFLPLFLVVPFGGSGNVDFF